MNTLSSIVKVPPSLQALAAMGMLLERLECLPRRDASAAQYREAVRKQLALLAEADSGPALQSLLDVLPATAELYENLHYAQAGLCRTPLESALPAELAARAVIDRLRGAAAGR